MRRLEFIMVFAILVLVLVFVVDDVSGIKADIVSAETRIAVLEAFQEKITRVLNLDGER